MEPVDSNALTIGVVSILTSFVAPLLIEWLKAKNEVETAPKRTFEEEIEESYRITTEHEQNMVKLRSQGQIPVFFRAKTDTKTLTQAEREAYMVTIYR